MYSLLVFTSLLSLSFLFAGPFFCYFHCPPNNHRLTTSWTSWTSKTDGRFPSGKKWLGWPTLEQLITEKKGACYTRYIQISRWKIPDITRCVAVAVGKQAPGLETGFFLEQCSMAGEYNQLSKEMVCFNQSQRETIKLELASQFVNSSCIYLKPPKSQHIHRHMTPNRTAPNSRIQTGRYQHNSVAGLVLPEMALSEKLRRSGNPPQTSGKKKHTPRA